MTQAEAENIFTDSLYHLPPKVIVALGTPWHLLSENDVTLLNKILNSVQLSLDGVQIIEAQSIECDSLVAYQPNALLGFGIILKPAIAPYTLTQVNGINILLADSLDNLDDAKKKDLWLSLKQMFPVS